MAKGTPGEARGGRAGATPHEDSDLRAVWVLVGRGAGFPVITSVLEEWNASIFGIRKGLWTTTMTRKGGQSSLDSPHATDCLSKKANTWEELSYTAVLP